MTGRIWHLAGALVLLAGLPSCADKVSSGPPPMLAISAANCSPVPDLSSGTALAFDPKNDKSLTRTIDASTACMVGPTGAKSSYAVFVLPASSDPFVVAVASTPVGYGLFVPRVELLDEKGQALRKFAPDVFVFRNSDLSLIFRSHGDERYLVVASDAASVGQTVTRLQESIGMTPVVAGPVVFEAHTGSDETTNLVLAHSGKITVTLSAIPTAK